MKKHRKVKIGLFLDPDREYREYELRILHRILNNDLFDLACIIKYKKNRHKKKTIKFYNIVNYFENKLTSGNRLLEFDKTRILTQIKALKSFEFIADEQDDVATLNQDCLKNIEYENLDLILLLEFINIKGKLLNIPKFGIWSFIYGNYQLEQIELIGFWEIYNRDPVTQVSLQVLTNCDYKVKLLQQGYYSTANFWLLNQEEILEKSTELLFKQLNILYYTNKIQPKKFKKDLMTFDKPSLYASIFYIVTKYSYGLRQKGKRLTTKIGTKDTWKLHLGKGGIKYDFLQKSVRIDSPENEFWADPFLYKVDNDLYVFFENYEYSKEKGKISVGCVKDNNIVNVEDVLDLSYHLSYPFIFNHKNSIYMIPETHQKERLEIWKCKEFPTKWSLEKICFDGISLVDSTIIKDKNGFFWLFTNISYDKFNNHNSYLYVYQLDSPLMKNITPHKLNPVITDCRIARNAGNIYFDNDKMIRPSQVSESGLYGISINLNHIKKLTIDEYEEEVIERILPDFKKGLFKTHHICTIDNQFVVDGCYKV